MLTTPVARVKVVCRISSSARYRSPSDSTLSLSIFVKLRLSSACGPFKLHSRSWETFCTPLESHLWKAYLAFSGASEISPACLWKLAFGTKSKA